MWGRGHFLTLLLALRLEGWSPGREVSGAPWHLRGHYPNAECTASRSRADSFPSGAAPHTPTPRPQPHCGCGGPCVSWQQSAGSSCSGRSTLGDWALQQPLLSHTDLQPQPLPRLPKLQARTLLSPGPYQAVHSARPDTGAWGQPSAVGPVHRPLLLKAPVK